MNTMNLYFLVDRLVLWDCIFGDPRRFRTKSGRRGAGKERKGSLRIVSLVSNETCTDRSTDFSKIDARYLVFITLYFST
jgi:hypothetical protein